MRKNILTGNLISNPYCNAYAQRLSLSMVNRIPFSGQTKSLKIDSVRSGGGLSPCPNGALMGAAWFLVVKNEYFVNGSF